MCMSERYRFSRQNVLKGWDHGWKERRFELEDKEKAARKCCSYVKSPHTTEHGNSSSKLTPLYLQHLFAPILTQGWSLAIMRVVLIVRARMKAAKVRAGSSSSEDTSDFDSEKAQGTVGDWVLSLPLQSHKMLAVMPMETLQKRTNI